MDLLISVIFPCALIFFLLGLLMGRFARRTDDLDVLAARAGLPLQEDIDRLVQRARDQRVSILVLSCAPVRRGEEPEQGLVQYRVQGHRFPSAVDEFRRAYDTVTSDVGAITLSSGSVGEA